MGKLAVVETTSTMASGPFRSAADGRRDVNITYEYVFEGAAAALVAVEFGTTKGPAVLIS